MYFHASPTKGIELLLPRISEDRIPLVYFSEKRENVLVYLSNAIEKYCRETGFEHSGKWTKWGPYGFDKDGRQRIEEYYPGALQDAYKGASGYIYTAEVLTEAGFQPKIPYTAVSGGPVRVTGHQFVPDAFDAILKAEKEGLITILRYEDNSPDKLDLIESTIKKEYEAAVCQPEYRHFLRGKFPFVK